VEEGGFELVPRKTPGVLAGVGSRSRRLILVGGKSGRGDKRRSLDPVVSRGTDSSNPVPSSGESRANLIDVSTPVIAGQLLSSRGEKTAARYCRRSAARS
jgi:hypothetical protein